ncbi:MAG: 4-phosphoerythronate dehydrogenase [Gammaproteobacteria bacterium]|nr:4-phosphoerythronate dehydrogenase [Gammaproteobacteria bacterium]
MLNILADDTLPELDLAFPAPFHLTRYRNQTELQEALPDHTILLCRSTLKVNQSLLTSHHLDWVLTASSGRDHLDESYLAQQKTKILDAKGSNASAVVDYVLSSMAYLQIALAFEPKTIGIIGVGEVGQRLLERLTALGFTVLCFDPLREGFQSIAFERLVECCLVCLHANLHTSPPHPSYHLIQADFCAARSPHSAIINASRGNIIDETALLAHHKGLYCTDVYTNEPNPNPQIIQQATLCTPHIAGHTQEAKIEAVRQLSRQLHAELGLPCPLFPAYPTFPALKSRGDWQSTYLAIYNPIDETQRLKENKPFLALRAAHVRHGREYYS